MPNGKGSSVEIFAVSPSMMTSKLSGRVNAAPGSQCDDVTRACKIVLAGGVGAGAGVGAGVGAGGVAGGSAGGSAGGCGVVCVGCWVVGVGVVGDPPHAARPSARTMIVCFTLPSGQGKKHGRYHQCLLIFTAERRVARSMRARSSSLDPRRPHSILPAFRRPQRA